MGRLGDIQSEKLLLRMELSGIDRKSIRIIEVLENRLTTHSTDWLSSSTGPKFHPPTKSVPVSLNASASAR